MRNRSSSVAVDRDDTRDRGPAERQRAGLVEQHGFDERIRSRASRSLTRMPARAATAVDREITSGIARPSACGHAITSTLIERSTALDASPSASHTANVTQRRSRGDVEQQRGEAIGQAPGRGSARLAPPPPAVRYRRARCRSRPRHPKPDRRAVRHRAGDDRDRPSFFGTGRDSPVIIDSSSSASPSSTMPSAGTRAPGRTSTMSSTRSSSSGIVFDRAVGSHPFRGVRQQLGECRAARPGPARSLSSPANDRGA